MTFVFFLLIRNVTEILKIFRPDANVILTVLFFLSVYGAENHHRKLSVLSYMAFILVFLFYRIRQENNSNFDFYLTDWLKLIMKNRIVFINIFGNLILFVPLVFYFDMKYSLLGILALILFLEGMQLLTRRGIFDIVDIFLNVIGILGGAIVKWRIYGQRTKQKHTRT